MRIAKDDYHVIVYKILNHLYSELKKGNNISGGYIENRNGEFKVPYEYWVFIIESLASQGYIKGVWTCKTNYIDGKERKLIAYDYDLSITALGIDYLFDNTLIRKAENSA